MLAATYQQKFPGRINTEFIGMASRYSQHKQRRKTQQDRKKSLESNYHYSEHQEKQLQRTIYSKSVELNKLQSSRLRKLEDIKAKEELNELRQFQIEQLRSRNHRLREENKRKLELARNKRTTMNHQGWTELKVSLKNQTQSLKQRIQQKLKSKARQCLLIRERETIGLQRVDSFYLQKNSENLEAYMKRIKQENRIKKENESKAKKLAKDLTKLNKSVYLKRNYLICLDQEISKYKTDIHTYNQSRISKTVGAKDDYLKAYDKTFSSMYKNDPNKSQ